MEYKSFNTEHEAIVYRESKRDEGLAASLFTYGKDRHIVKVMETTDDKNPGWTQRYLSDQAWKVSRDINDLTEVKEIISSPDYPNWDYDNTLAVAKKLEKERWFNTPKDVIGFFDSPDTGLDEIKAMVDTALAEYEDDWNEYRELSKP